MRRLAFAPAAALVALAALVAAGCSDAPRRTYKVALEGQSPPEPEKPAGLPVPVEPPPADSAAAVSPAWLRSNSPIAWTSPAGWEELQSTKPQRLVEFTLEKNGPGRAPIQFLILNGADESPRAKEASLTSWQTKYREDQAMQTTESQHHGVTVTRHRIHGTYEYPAIQGVSDAINEDNWTMICGWVEGPNGSIMYRVQGPDAIINANLAKIDALLASMKPAEKKP